MSYLTLEYSFLKEMAHCVGKVERIRALLSNARGWRLTTYKFYLAYTMIIVCKNIKNGEIFSQAQYFFFFFTTHSFEKCAEVLRTVNFTEKFWDIFFEIYSKWVPERKLPIFTPIPGGVGKFASDIFAEIQITQKIGLSLPEKRCLIS